MPQEPGIQDDAGPVNPEDGISWLLRNRRRILEAQSGAGFQASPSHGHCSTPCNSTEPKLKYLTKWAGGWKVRCIE